MSTADGPIRSSAFTRFWAAATMSAVGTTLTSVAVPVLVITVLGASPFEVGLVSAAQFLPYAVLGLIAGVVTDRFRRKPVLVWSSIGRALCLGIIPILWLCDVLDVWMLVIVLFGFGGFSVFGVAAAQSLLPRIVPRSHLLRANARLDQSDAAAQSLGPTLGGALVGVLGAPVAIVIDSVSYLVDAGLNATVRVDEPTGPRRARRLRAEVGEGLRWTYRHRVLGPLTISTHIWFIANGAAMTVLSLFVLRDLGHSPFAFGLLLTALGIASLIGAFIAPTLGGRFGAGRAIIITRCAYPFAWLLIVTAPDGPIGTAMLVLGLGVHGWALGAENSPEQLLWQTLTPDELLGRTNATRRAGNRTLAALGAATAGLLVGVIGARPALITVIIVFAVAAVIAVISPLRQKHPSDEIAG